ncbi:MAG: hypothetical protein P8X59_06950 [Woeseiaceae bacterium]|jgi:hypothetical protein
MPLYNEILEEISANLANNAPLMCFYTASYLLGEGDLAAILNK